MASEHDKEQAYRPSDRRMRPRKPQRADRRMEAKRSPEHRRRRLIAILTGSVIVLAIAGVVAYGYYDIYVAPTKVLAARVGDKTYTQGDLVKRMRVLQADFAEQGQSLDLGSEPFNVLASMADAEIIRRAAPGYNIRVTDDEVELALILRFYPRIPEGQDVIEGQVEREFQVRYRSFLEQRHISDGDYRELVEERVYRSRMREKLGEQLPTVAEQVEVHWIQLPSLTGGDPLGGPSQPSPEDVRERLKTERFRDVVAEFSVDRLYADDRGYVGWIPKGAFPFLDPAMFGDEERGPIGHNELSEPLTTIQGTYILKVSAGPELQEISEKMLERLKNKALDSWLLEQKGIGSDEGWLELKFNSDIYAWVNDQVRQALPRGVTLTPPRR